MAVTALQTPDTPITEPTKPVAPVKPVIATPATGPVPLGGKSALPSAPTGTIGEPSTPAMTLPSAPVGNPTGATTTPPGSAVTPFPSTLGPTAPTNGSQTTAAPTVAPQRTLDPSGQYYNNPDGSITWVDQPINWSKQVASPEIAANAARASAASPMQEAYGTNGPVATTAIPGGNVAPVIQQSFLDARNSDPTGTYLNNGTLTQNGKVTALENGTGAFVDPITGALTNAGGAIGAQSSTATAGVPGSVNGTPIVQWLQSQGMLQPGTPDATGSMAPGTPGGGNSVGGTTAGLVGGLVNGANGGNSVGGTTAGLVGGLLGNGNGSAGPGGSTSGPYANTQQIVPGGSTDLTSQLITPGAGTDRLQLAKQYEDAWNAATNPQFAADQRDALRSAAAGGALGSGQLNTTLGSLTGNRDLQRNAAMQNFLTNAQQGSIEDAFRKLGILQQQQGFQAGQQNTAFNQGLLQNEVGNMNNPDTLLAELAAQYNQQAGQAAGSVGQLAQASSANQNGQIPAWLLPLLQGASGQYAPPPTSTATGGY